MEIIEVEELMMSSRTFDLLFTRNLRWVNEFITSRSPVKPCLVKCFKWLTKSNPRAKGNTSFNWDCIWAVASYPGLLNPAFVACSTNTCPLNENTDIFTKTIQRIFPQINVSVLASYIASSTYHNYNQTLT